MRVTTDSLMDKNELMRLMLFSGQMQFLTERMEMLKSQLQVKEDLERVWHMLEGNYREERVELFYPVF